MICSDIGGLRLVTESWQKMRPGLLNRLEERHLRGRRKATLYAVLTVLWVFPSLGGLWILWMHWTVWSGASTLLDGIRMTRLEQWIALALLVTHATFINLTRRYARNEPRLRHDENPVDPMIQERPRIDG